MKKFIHFTLLLFISFFIVACTAPAKNHGLVKIANPSSEYCVSIGGMAFSKKDSTGNEIGYCKLPDGQIVDAWDFFRKNNSPRDRKSI